MKLQINIKLLYTLLILAMFPFSIYANDPFGTLPSDQTLSELDQMATTSSDGTLFAGDWWTGDEDGDGPPTEGGGGGGAVGIPLSEGGVPVFVAGLLYLSILGLKRSRTNRRKIVIE